MQSIGKVLVVLDKPGAHQAALERARNVAGPAGAHLHLVSFCWLAMAEYQEVFDTHQRSALKQGAVNERERWLRSMVLDAGLAAADVTTEVVWTKDIAAWIAERVDAGHADLVVKSTRHETGKLLRTPLDWRLLRSCHAPLLLVGAETPPRSGNVLATIDLRHVDEPHQRMNDRVLAASQTFAHWLGGQLHCAHVIEGTTLPPGAEILGDGELLAQAQKGLGELLDRTIASYDLPRTAVHMPVAGLTDAVNELVERERIGLVVVGTSARRGLGGLLLGNSAERLLSRVDCDLLAMHP